MASEAEIIPTENVFSSSRKILNLSTSAGKLPSGQKKYILPGKSSGA